MQILETIKAHPVYIIGALGVVFVGYIWLTSGGSGAQTGSTGDIYAAQNAAGDQLQMAGIAAQAQEAAIGADLTKTQIQAQNNLDIAKLSKDLAITQINAGSMTTDLANTLTANVAMKNIQSGVDIKQIDSNTTLGTTNIIANALVAQSVNSSNVAIAGINAAASTNAAAIAAASAASKRSCGLLGYIVGC